MRREQLENNTTTSLNGAITDVATSITVANGSVLPATGDYRIIIGDEIMLVTARSTNVLTVERGAESTTAVAQSGGASVRMILTAASLNKWMDDVSGGSSERYPFRVLDDADATQVVSDFTWVNQSTSTATDETWGGVKMTAPSVAAINLRLLVQTAPAAPWKMTGHIGFGPGMVSGTSGSMMGICARENATGKIQTIALQLGDSVEGNRYTGPATFTSKLGTSFDMDVSHMWMQIEDDNTNIILRVSSDGISWMDIGQEARGTFPTTAYDELGFFIESASADANALFHINSWIIE